MGFEPLNQNKINRVHANQQVWQARFRPLRLMQQGPAAGRGDEYLMRTREAVPMAVLAGLIHVEAMMSVLDGRYGQPRRAEQWQEGDEQGGFAATGPTDDPQNFQDAAFSPADVGEDPGRRRRVRAKQSHG